MTNLRSWVVILALVCIAAGGALGFWVAAGRYRAAPQRGPFADYEQMLVATFQLSPERERALRDVLASYQQDLEQIKDRHVADYMSAMEPELRAKGLYYRDLIHDKVLPESQRAEFDRLALGEISSPVRH